MMNQHRASEASEKVSICVLEVEWRSYSEYGEGWREGGRASVSVSVSEGGGWVGKRVGEREGGRNGRREGDSCLGS